MILILEGLCRIWLSLFFYITFFNIFLVNPYFNHMFFLKYYFNVLLLSFVIEEYNEEKKHKDYKNLKNSGDRL